MALAYGPVDRLYERANDGSVVLSVHVQPGAGRTGPAGRHGEALKLRVAAPAERGRANDAVAELVAVLFGLKRRQVTIVSGHAARSKRVRLDGLDEAAFRDRLDSLLIG
jgi:uncharacterized protein